jgi:hypothetical protein
MVNKCKRIIGGDDTVIAGGARGADSLARQMATQFRLKYREFPADWDKHGKSAGYKRNEDMARNADGLVAFWDGYSKGTKHMIDIALREGLEVHVYFYARVRQ